MGLQEFSIALVSVILGLGLTDLLGNLNRLIRARRRVRWDALPLLWAALALMLVVNFWWGIYLGLTTVETPANAAEYLASLTTPIALYLVCAAALPGEVPEAGLDLAGSYFAERRYFFGVLLVYLLSTAVNTMVVARVWQWNAINMLRLGVLVLGASLLFSRARWYHWTATILFGALLLLRMLNMTARPG